MLVSSSQPEGTEVSAMCLRARDLGPKRVHGEVVAPDLTVVSVGEDFGLEGRFIVDSKGVDDAVRLGFKPGNTADPFTTVCIEEYLALRPLGTAHAYHPMRRASEFRGGSCTRRGRSPLEVISVTDRRNDGKFNAQTVYAGQGSLLGGKLMAK